MSVRVLVIGTQAGEAPPGLPEGRSGAEYVITSDLDEVRAALPGTEIVFQYGTPKDALRGLWELASDVRWVHVGGVGVDAVLFEEFVKSDVALTNSRGVFDVSLPEYLLTLMLALVKDLPATIRAQADGVWRHRWLDTLSGGHVVILGAGSIARGAARLLRAVGMTVTLVGRSAREGGVDERIRAMSELGELLPGADWLVGLLPLTPSTRGLVGARELALLPSRARVVNIGRGQLFVQGDLVEALEQGAIRAAALDVFEVEPLPLESPLWRMPNVIVSPHEGGDVTATPGALIEAFMSNLNRYLAGDQLQDVVDKHVGFVSAKR
jgi:phosphoglycerate dehydrogenase-like enzyme